MWGWDHVCEVINVVVQRELSRAVSGEMKVAETTALGNIETRCDADCKSAQLREACSPHCEKAMQCLSRSSTK